MIIESDPAEEDILRGHTAISLETLPPMRRFGGIKRLP